MNETSGAMDLARLVLRLGRVNRATMDVFGQYESDTTHSVMLALWGMALAKSYDLDPGKVAQFAMVHDLPEAYAGDVCTARGLTIEQRANKDASESLARATIRESDLCCFLDLLHLLDQYEQQAIPEARFVRYLDKLTPKLTHILNEGTALRRMGMTRAEMKQSHRNQGVKLRQEYPEFSKLGDVFDELCRLSEDAVTLRDE